MKKIYLIGNAHLDPAWMWRWQEGFAEIKATFRSALDRMNEFSDFKFVFACSLYYMWIEKSDKKMFDEFVARVKEGRWSIVGGWYMQPDCNIPSGESFARHALISQRYFKEKFGVIAYTGYNVDTDVHISVLGTEFDAQFSHNEVKTFIINDGKVSPADFMEWVQ